MNKITFTGRAWKEYCYWQTQDKKTLKKINLLLEDIKKKWFYRNRETRTIKA